MGRFPNIGVPFKIFHFRFSMGFSEKCTIQLWKGNPHSWKPYETIIWSPPNPSQLPDVLWYLWRCRPGAGEWLTILTWTNNFCAHGILISLNKSQATSTYFIVFLYDVWLIISQVAIGAWTKTLFLHTLQDLTHVFSRDFNCEPSSWSRTCKTMSLPGVYGFTTCSCRLPGMIRYLDGLILGVVQDGAPRWIAFSCPQKWLNSTVYDVYGRYNLI